MSSSVTGMIFAISRTAPSASYDASVSCRLLFNPILQESPSSKQSERWRGMEESSDMIRLSHEEMAG